MNFVVAIVLLVTAFVFSGLEAAWLSLDRVRLRHRADKGHRRARQILAWDDAWPQANLVMAWTGQAAAAASLVLFASALAARHAPFWLTPVLFLPVYVLLVQLLARRAFRRLPFDKLDRIWWMVPLAGSFWSVLARPTAIILRAIKPLPLPHPPAEEELMAAAAIAPGISALELNMLRRVLDFRHLTSGGMALPPERFVTIPAERLLHEALTDPRMLETRHALIVDADGLPLGAMDCGAAALSEAKDARVQSFARPLLILPSDLPAWSALIQLRRAPTPVAEVRDQDTGERIGVLTEDIARARLLP